MERLLVRFSIWLLRNLRSCIRSSTCLSRAAMRSCLLSSMHWSLVMVSSTLGGRLSAWEAAKGRQDRRVKFHFVCIFEKMYVSFVLQCSYQTWRCWVCCPELHQLRLLTGSSPTWWCAVRLVPASARPERSSCLCTSQSWSRSLGRGSNLKAPAATQMTSLQTWKKQRLFMYESRHLEGTHSSRESGNIWKTGDDITSQKKGLITQCYIKLKHINKRISGSLCVR